ncbi:MAG TPA: sulfite exporter TauE/SafE family protein [Methylomirabilota bacterium]|nr:sulfite exporter TauE/SafE family protein [Methylomirabilota bacterium]
MPDLTGWVILLVGALVGSVVGGIAGFGAGIILLPLLAWTFGVRAAAPLLTVTMLLGNLSRIWWSRTEVDHAVTIRFLAGAVPATVVGAVFYAAAPVESLRWVMGAFLIAAVPVRRLLLTRWVGVRLRHFPALGAAIGVLSGIVVATGPVMTPFLLAYGLRRGAYIATEAVCALGMHAARAATFTRYSLLSWEALVIGGALGSVMFAGSWLGRRLLDRMTDRVFLALIEALLILMGLQFLLVSR